MTTTALDDLRALEKMYRAPAAFGGRRNTRMADDLRPIIEKLESEQRNAEMVWLDKYRAGLRQEAIGVCESLGYNLQKAHEEIAALKRALASREGKP